MARQVRPPREGAEIIDVRTGQFTGFATRFFNDLITLLNQAGDVSEGAVPASLYNNNTILKADIAAIPQPLSVGVNRLVGRASSGGIDDLTPDQVRDVLDFGAIGIAMTQAETADEGRDILVLGSIATQDHDAVAITGGSIVNITDLAVSDGGTGASDGAGARANLGFHFTRVSTQFDKTDTTLASVTGLSVAVSAAGVYEFTARLHVTADATGGHKYAIGGSCTATSIIYEIVSISSAGTLVITSRQTALGSAAGEAGAATSFTEIKGLIVVANAGALEVQFAQNSANGTSSVLAGSTFIVTEAA